MSSLIVVVAVLASAWATCAEGAEAPATQQMICCQGGHDQCPMKDSAANCCKISGPRVEQQAAITKEAPPTADPLVPLLWTTLPEFTLCMHMGRGSSHDTSDPHQSNSPPSYIAFSALLI